MNLLLTMMKRWPSALASLLLMCLLAVPAVAGEWEFDGYYWSGSSNSVNLTWTRKYSNGGESYNSYTQTGKNVFRDQKQDAYHPIPPHYAEIITSGLGLSGESVRHSGLATPTGEIGSSVYARFNWRRDMKGGYDEATGDYSEYPDPDDNPPSYVYVRESASVSAGGYIQQQHGNPTGYTILSPWLGDYYDIQGEAMGVSLAERSRNPNNPANSWLSKPNSKSEIRKIAVSGDSVTVPSRSFSGQVKLSPGYEKEQGDRYTSAYLDFGYGADPLNFLLHASAPTVAHRQQTFDAEEVDALVGLSWIYPNHLQTDDDGNVHAVPDPADVASNWRRFTGGAIDEQAPLPYFEGVATFNLTANNGDGRTSIYSSPTYTWTPEGTTTAQEAFAVPGGEPQVTVTNDLQRTYAWNFGTATDGSVSFPKTTSVSVEMKSSEPDQPDTLKAEAKINWHTTWTPTETGLQKNVVTPQFDWLILPDGSPLNANNVKPGDTILCFVEGDPGFSTDGSRVEKIRPVPDGQRNSPGPGERVEPRVVGKVVPTGNGGTIIIFNSTPKVNPDDDPNAPGFDEIQNARQVAAANQQAYQTGKALTKTALELQLEVMKAMSFGPAEGVALESAIKGVIAVGRFAEASRALKAITPTLEKGAEETLLASKAIRTVERDTSIGATRATELEKVAVDVERQAGRSNQLAKDSKSLTNVGEKYTAESLAKLKERGCFVAGTPVWMADGTTKPIEQVKVGDTVLSKNEKTGEIAAKKVLHTSVRQNIWTRKLTFENGAVVETTDEHPLYVEGSGFAKAKEVGIGSSIVTRAGPSAKVVAVGADVRQTTVYNFTVDQFHTYFVGQDALWAHNQNCPITPAPDIWDHVRRGNGIVTPPGGFPRVPRGGVDGAHNMDQFIGQYVRTGEVNVLTMTPHPNLPGVYRVEYQIKSYDSAGNMTGWVNPSNGPNKTLYDPAVQDELEYFVRMTQARESARINGNTNIGGGRGWSGRDGEGNLWEGFDNASGEYRTGYPVW